MINVYGHVINNGVVFIFSIKFFAVKVFLIDFTVSFYLN